MDRTSESRLEALEITHKKLDDRLKEFEEHEPKNFRWSHFRTLLQEAPGKKNPSEVYCFIDQLLSDYDPPESMIRYHEIPMKALKLDDEAFEDKAELLLFPAKGRHHAPQQLKEPGTPSSPCSPSGPEPAPVCRLLGPKQWNCFMETADAKKALRSPPTSPPSSRKTSAEEPRSPYTPLGPSKNFPDAAPDSAKSSASARQAAPDATPVSQPATDAISDSQATADAPKASQPAADATSASQAATDATSDSPAAADAPQASQPAADATLASQAVTDATSDSQAAADAPQADQPAADAPSASQPAADATSASQAAADKRLVEDGICPQWKHPERSCTSAECHLNHCELTDPDFDHGKVPGERAELFALLKKLSAKRDLELAKLVGALRRTLPFMGREDFFERLGSELMAAMEAARISDPTREHATLAAVIDGAGQGKTRILEELQACADIPLWPTLLKLKLGLGSEALQAFQNGLACFPIIDLASNSAKLTPKDAEFTPDVSLGLRLACALFLRNANVLKLHSTLTDEQLWLFTLENLLPIAFTALRRRARDEGRCKQAASKVLMGVQLDELQCILKDMSDPLGSHDAAAAFGRGMCRGIGEVVANAFTYKYGAALMLIGAGTRAPHDNIFNPTDFNIRQLHVGPLALPETVNVLVSALSETAWKEYEGLKGITEAEVREVLTKGKILDSLAELGGVPRSVQWAYMVLAQGEVMARVRNRGRIKDYDHKIADQIHKEVETRLGPYMGNALADLVTKGKQGKQSNKPFEEILQLVLAALPISDQHKLAGGASISECLESGVLYVESTSTHIILRLTKQQMLLLVQSRELPNYGQLDLGYGELKGDRLEELFEGIIPLRSALLTKLGVKECYFTTLVPGAIGPVELLRKRVKVKPITVDQDVTLFVRPPKKEEKAILCYHEERDLRDKKGFREASGYRQIRCDLPSSSTGHKQATLIDIRLTLHYADGDRPLMIVQQVKGKEGKGRIMQKQGLELWYEKVRELLKNLYKEWDIVAIYFTRQVLGREGWQYVAAQQHGGSGLLVVSRQTMSAYLPVAQDRLAVSELLDH